LISIDLNRGNAAVRPNSTQLIPSSALNSHHISLPRKIFIKSPLISSSPAHRAIDQLGSLVRGQAMSMIHGTVTAATEIKLATFHNPVTSTSKDQDSSIRNEQRDQLMDAFNFSILTFREFSAFMTLLRMRI
jgi:hypothetical protein